VISLTPGRDRDSDRIGPRGRARTRVARTMPIRTGARGLELDEGCPTFRRRFLQSLEDIIAKLNAAIVTALANPALQQKLIDLGQEIPLRDQQTPEALSAYQKTEAEK
jgi:hypothetical protein